MMYVLKIERFECNRTPLADGVSNISLIRLASSPSTPFRRGALFLMVDVV